MRICYSLPLILCIGIILPFGCSKSEKKENIGQSGKKTAKYRLAEVKEISFPLDTLTGFSQHSLQFFTNGNQRYLSFFNTVANAIYTYDYDTRQLKKRILFRKEGPDGVGPNYQMGHLVVNFDTIYLLNYMTKVLLLTDTTGKIRRKYNLTAEDEKNMPHAQLETNFPAFKIENKLYLIGFNFYTQNDHTKLNNTICLDLATGDVSYLFARPKFYNKGHWGYFKYITYHCYNPHTEKFLISFGGSPDLYEADPRTFEMKPLKAASPDFEEFKPLDPNHIKLITDEEKMNQYDFTTPSYGPVLYDIKKRVYYRIAFHPVSVDEFKLNPRSVRMKTGIVILSESFEFLGETIMPVNEYQTMMYFLTDDGLHIAKRNRYKENENELTFGIFNLFANE